MLPGISASHGAVSSGACCVLAARGGMITGYPADEATDRSCDHRPRARFILRLRLTRVPPDFRGGTCPWRFPAAKLVLPEQEHSSIIKFLTPTITCGPDPWRSRPASSCNIPPRPAFSIPRCAPTCLDTFAAPARCRDSTRKVEEGGQEKRPHYESDSSAISSIFASSSGSTSPGSSGLIALNWAAHCESSFVRKAVLLARSAKVTRYVRLFICPSPGESRSSERRSGGTPAARSNSLPAAALATSRRPLCRAGRPSRDLGLLLVSPLELWLCFRPSAPAVSDLNSCRIRFCFDSKLALFGAFGGVVTSSGRHSQTPSPCPGWPAACAPSWDKIPIVSSVASSVTR